MNQTYLNNGQKIDGEPPTQIFARNLCSVVDQSEIFIQEGSIERQNHVNEKYDVINVIYHLPSRLVVLRERKIVWCACTGWNQDDCREHIPVVFKGVLGIYQTRFSKYSILLFLNFFQWPLGRYFYWRWFIWRRSFYFREKVLTI